MTKDKQHLPERINGRLYFRDGDRLIPAVFGAAGEPGDGDKPAPEEKLSREDVIQIVNAAITNHGKRQASSLEKLIAEQFAKLTEKPAADPPKEGDKEGREKAREREYAELKRRLDESEERARRVEEASRQKDTQSKLRALLDGANVRPELLDVAVGHLAKVTSALRYDEDGAPSLFVKRVRVKGALPEEIPFSDLKAGVEDWAQTDEAKPFLKPPQTGGQRGAANSGAPFSPNGRANRRDPLDEIFSKAAREAAGSTEP
jgi:plasmid stabilization system protein ParE